MTLLPVSLPVRPSRALTAVLLLAHALAVAGVLLVDMPLWTRAGLAAVLLGSALVSARRYGLLLGDTAVTTLRLTDKGTLEIENARGECCSVRVSAATTVFGMLIVLLYRGERGSQSLVLPTDALGGDAHRRLRVWLRWRAETS